MTIIPPGCRVLTEALTVNGWSFMLNHGTDTGDNPYISTEARRGTDTLMVTWHTRDTGTYRLFTCMVNKRDATFTKIMQAVAA